MSVAEAWDAVVSCFFIDTAHNIVEYLEVIAKALKPGGVCLCSLILAI
jgi:carnosine N-methyltransferase